MASVHNSTIGTLEKGAALTAANNPTGKGFVGQWEDVKDYTSVITTYTITPDQAVSLSIQWSNTDDFENPTIIATDTFSVLAPDSVQVRAKARWVRLVCEKTEGDDTFTVKIATLYKKAPTEISLTENNSEIVSVNEGDNHNSIKTVLTDSAGVAIGDNTAMYVSLTDNTGKSIADAPGERVTTPFTSGENGVALSANGNYGTLVRLYNSEYEGFEISTTEVFDRTTINSSNNTINLPKKYATFSHGDIVNFFVYVRKYGNTSSFIEYYVPAILSDAVSVSNIAQNNGKIIVQARVNVINTDATHITFQLMVDVDTSKWFDPDSNAYLFDTYGLSRDNTYFGNIVSTYYVYFKNSLQNSAKLLYPGQYPLDMKLYIGSALFPGIGGLDYGKAAFQLVSTPPNIFHTGLHLSINSPTQQLSTTSYSYNPAAFTQLKLNIMIDCHHFVPNDENYVSRSLFNNAQLTTVINTFCNAFPNALQTKTGKNFLPTPNGGDYIVKAQVLTSGNEWLETITSPLQLNKSNNNFTNPTIPYINRSYPFQPGRWLMLNTNATLNRYSYTTYIYPTIQMLDDTDTIIIVIGSKLENISDAFFNFDTYPHIKMLYNLFKHIKLIVVAPYTAGLNEMESHQIRILTNFAGSKDNIIWYKDYNDLISPSFLQKLADRTIVTSKESTTINNTLLSHTANSAGISQAATTYINTDNSGVAMYYTITDTATNSLDSTLNSGTNTTGLNAMHVSLAVPNLTGFSRLTDKTPLHVTVSTIHTPIYPLDTVITSASIGAPVFLTESNDPLIQVNLNAIGFVNESPILAWVRLYNITQQGIIDLKDNIRGTDDWNDVPDKEQKLQNRLAGYDNDGNNYNAANDKLKLNIAVSSLSSRDLDLCMPIRFPNGIHVSASSSNNYTSIDTVGDHEVFLHGAWAPVAVS